MTVFEVTDIHVENIDQLELTDIVTHESYKDEHTMQIRLEYYCGDCEFGRDDGLIHHNLDIECRSLNDLINATAYWNNASPYCVLSPSHHDTYISHNKIRLEVILANTENSYF